MTIRTLIVDDEPLAREKLRAFLEKETDFEVAGECGDGRQAVEFIRSNRPDLVFLDIQMPELDGMGVVGEIGADAMPLVVFVTAFDQFALKAFEMCALDYLLKPFDRERFESAVGRVRERIRLQHSGDLNQQLSALLDRYATPDKGGDRIAIKTAGRLVFLKFDEIDWIEASDNYVNLHAGKESHLHRETMNQLEAKLPASRFLRINRSNIVNLDRIKELQPMFHGEYAVILRNGTRLTLSRNFRDKLEAMLGK